MQAKNSLESLNLPNARRRVYHTLAKFYIAQSDYKQGFQYYKKYTAIKDSLFNKTKSEQIAEMQTKYETNEKIKENLLLKNENTLKAADIIMYQLKEKQTWLEKREQEQENKLLIANNRLKKEIIERQQIEQQKIEVKNSLLKKGRNLQKTELKHQKTLVHLQSMVMTIILIVLGFVIVIVGILYHLNRQRYKTNLVLTRQKQLLEVQKTEIEVQNREIVLQNEELHQQREELATQRDFIEYKNRQLKSVNTRMKGSIKTALTIQQSILPYQHEINTLLNTCFVIYSPRDIVSGDFYWLSKIENKVVLIVVDCTGHGVPGAFMSLIGSTLLDKIVKVWKVTSPAKILTLLHEEIRTVLRQKKTQNDWGMDAAVLRLEKVQPDSTQIVFSGAKRPLYYWRKGTKIVKKLKGDRKTVGGDSGNHTEFTERILLLESGSIFYAGSDGFADQNDVNRMRLGERRLLTFLEEIKEFSVEIQKKRLLALLEKHKKDTTQRDDILFMGVKV